MISLARILAVLLAVGFVLIFFKPGRVLFDVAVFITLLLILLEIV